MTSNKYRSLEHIIQDMMLEGFVDRIMKKGRESTNVDDKTNFVNPGYVNKVRGDENIDKTGLPGTQSGKAATSSFEADLANFANANNPYRPRPQQPESGKKRVKEDRNSLTAGMRSSSNIEDRRNIIDKSQTTINDKVNKKFGLNNEPGGPIIPVSPAWPMWDKGTQPESGKKKKIKEDSASNVALIKKGASMLHSGPLTKYTNPQNPPSSQSSSAGPSPTLSFQTPDLAGNNKKEDDEIQTPKLKGKGDAKSDARAKSTPGATAKNVSKPTSDPFAPQSVLNKAEKVTNTLLGTSGTKAVAIPSAGTGATGGAATGGVAATTQVLNKLPQPSTNVQTNVGSPSGGNVKQNNPNADFPADKLQTNKFVDQKQAVPPVSPGGGMAGNTPKGTGSPSMENPSSPSKGSAPVDVVGKPAGEQTKFTSATDNKAGAPHVPPAIDHKSLPLSRASQTVPLLRNPPLPMSPTPVSTAEPQSDGKDRLPAPHQGGAETATVPSTKPGAVATADTPQPTNRGTRTGNDPEKDPGQIHRDKGVEGPGKGTQSKRQSAPDVDTTPETTWEKPKEYDSWTQKQKDDWEKLPKTEMPSNPWLDAIGAALGGAGVRVPKMSKIPKTGKTELSRPPKTEPKIETKPEIKIEKPETKAAKTPEQAKEKQGEFTSPAPKETEKPKIDQETRIKPAETKTETKPEKKPEEMKPEEKEKPAETKPEEKEKHGWRDKLGWAGLGAGGLALLRYLSKFGGKGGGRGDGKGGPFMYGKQGAISGVPTRPKGGGGGVLKTMMIPNPDIKEETENTKLRRAVELVGRRHGTNKKKSSLARQSAIKTRIIDEERYLQIVREAIKEKQDKDKEKKLKPGEHTTLVDKNPKLAQEPTQALRQ